MTSLRAQRCIYYEMEQQKPNSGCSTCPLPISESCNNEGVILYTPTVIEFRKGIKEMNKIRATFKRLIDRYSLEAIAAIGAEEGIWLEQSKIGKEAMDRLMVAIGKITSRKKVKKKPVEIASKEESHEKNEGLSGNGGIPIAVSSADTEKPSTILPPAPNTTPPAGDSPTSSPDEELTF